ASHRTAPGGGWFPVPVIFRNRLRVQTGSGSNSVSTSPGLGVQAWNFLSRVSRARRTSFRSTGRKRWKTGLSGWPVASIRSVACRWSVWTMPIAVTHHASALWRASVWASLVSRFGGAWLLAGLRVWCVPFVVVVVVICETSWARRGRKGIAPVLGCGDELRESDGWAGNKRPRGAVQDRGNRR